MAIIDHLESVEDSLGPELTALGEPKPTFIEFSTFQKIVLDYQLSEHIKFLGRFNDCFRQIDLDSNGIINRSEFRELMYLMNLFDMDAHSPEK